MSKRKTVEVATCEWCPEYASRRVTSRATYGVYRRFSCPKHHDKLDALIAIDLGHDVKCEKMTNPTGFNAATGRMLGPS